MSARYLLPCQCGHRTEVRPDQAGLEVTCACGAVLRVPTMRGLNSLERVADASVTAARPRAWGPGHAMAFVGAIIVAVGIGWGLLNSKAAGVAEQASIETDRAAHRADIEAASPAQLWIEWSRMPRSLEQIPVGDDQMSQREQFELVRDAQVLAIENQAWVGFGAAALGGIVCLIGIVLSLQRRPAAR